MDIKNIQGMFAVEAAKLGDYSLMTKTELANGYCDADEAAVAAKNMNDLKEVIRQEELRSAYYAALMLRYWHKIFEWAHNSASLHLELTDFVDWLADSLYVAFYYRTWRYQYQATVQHGRFIDWSRDENGELIPNPYWHETDPNAPDKIINRCCASMRGRVYQFYNKDKRKADITAGSLEQMVDDIGDTATAFVGCYEDAPSIDGVQYLVSALLGRGNDIEALIVDCIAYMDTFKMKKEVIEKTIPTEFGDVNVGQDVHKYQVFDARKLVKQLNHISPQFMRNFCERYSVEVERGDQIYSSLQALSNPKLYRRIQKTLIQIRDNPKLLGYLR